MFWCYLRHKYITTDSCIIKDIIQIVLVVTFDKRSSGDSFMVHTVTCQLTLYVYSKERARMNSHVTPEACRSNQLHITRMVGLEILRCYFRALRILSGVVHYIVHILTSVQTMRWDRRPP